MSATVKREDPVDDWDLLSSVADGDEEAFRQIVERHQERLVSLCFRLLGDREEALDAAQEVFLKLYLNAGGLRRRGAVFTWLYRVASNYCLNRLRRRRIVRFLPLSGSVSEAHALPEPQQLAIGPEGEVVAREHWRATRARIDRLPDSQRLVLVLAKFEGLSYRQIAEVLNISEGAVESRLFRAMRTLSAAQESRS